MPMEPSPGPSVDLSAADIGTLVTAGDVPDPPTPSPDPPPQPWQTDDAPPA